MRHRWLLWTLGAIALGLIGVGAFWYSQLREDAIRERIRATLARRFNADPHRGPAVATTEGSHSDVASINDPADAR